MATSLEPLLDRERRRLTQLWDAYEAQVQDMDAVLRRISRLARRLDRLEDETQNRQAMIHARDTRMRTLALDIERLTADRAENEAQVERLEAAIEDVREKYLRLYIFTEELGDDLAQAKSELAARDAWFVSIQPALTPAVEMVTDHESTIEALMARIIEGEPEPAPSPLPGTVAHAAADWLAEERAASAAAVAAGDGAVTTAAGDGAAAVWPPPTAPPPTREDALADLTRGSIVNTDQAEALYEAGIVSLRQFLSTPRSSVLDILEPTGFTSADYPGLIAMVREQYATSALDLPIEVVTHAAPLTLHPATMGAAVPLCIVAPSTHRHWLDGLGDRSAKVEYNPLYDDPLFYEPFVRIELQRLLATAFLTPIAAAEPRPPLVVLVRLRPAPIASADPLAIFVDHSIYLEPAVWSARGPALDAPTTVELAPAAVMAAFNNEVGVGSGSSAAPASEGGSESKDQPAALPRLFLDAETYCMDPIVWYLLTGIAEVERLSDQRVLVLDLMINDAFAAHWLEPLLKTVSRYSTDS